jgi:ATP-dependent Clp protease ATP-binding subunit ClpC
MTSNAGAREINKGTFGFQTGNGVMAHGDIKSLAMTELKRLFRPEFLNRVDEIVVFHSLEYDHVMKIMDLMLDEVRERLTGLSLTLDVNGKVRDMLMQMGYDSVYGARPLRRTIQKEIEDPLSVAILQGRFEPGDSISAEVRSGKISFRRKNRRKKAAGKKIDQKSEKQIPEISGDNSGNHPVSDSP